MASEYYEILSDLMKSGLFDTQGKLNHVASEIFRKRQAERKRKKWKEADEKARKMLKEIGMVLLAVFGTVCLMI